MAIAERTVNNMERAINAGAKRHWEDRIGPRRVAIHQIDQQVQIEKSRLWQVLGREPRLTDTLYRRAVEDLICQRRELSGKQYKDRKNARGVERLLAR